jgi:hypothetical protein
LQRRTILYLSAIAALSGVHAAHAAEQRPLELFGVALKGATRDQLRQAFKANGVRATREENQYWVDVYDAKGVLDGASELQTGYVAASSKFAYARYTFETFMDTELVGKVINMVGSKYGKPSSQSGSYGLGPVTARWTLGQGMQIEVSRGWPDTTTYLKFLDPVAHAQMQSEIDAERRAQESQKNKSQTKAF